MNFVNKPWFFQIRANTGREKGKNFIRVEICLFY